MNLYCAQAKCLQGRYAHHFMSAITVFVVCSICLVGCQEGSSPPLDMETTPDTATEMNMRPDADAVEDEGVSERRPINRDANDEMTETTDIFSTTPQDAEPQSPPDMSVDSQVIQDATPVICQPTDCLETPENTVQICEHTHQLKVTACEAQQNGECAWTTIPVQKVLNALMDDVLLDVTPEKNSWVKTTAIGVPVAPMDLPKMLNARNSIATKQAAVEPPIVPQINFVILKTIDARSKAAGAAVEKRTQRVRF